MEALFALFGINPDIDVEKLHKTPNEAELMTRSNKIKADNYAKARFKIQNETDPLKKEMMNSRLALGITDFSDI